MRSLIHKELYNILSFKALYTGSKVLSIDEVCKSFAGKVNKASESLTLRAGAELCCKVSTFLFCTSKYFE